MVADGIKYTIIECKHGNFPNSDITCLFPVSSTLSMQLSNAASVAPHNKLTKFNLYTYHIGDSTDRFMFTLKS